MTNVILPGIYITVRDEGLISVGGVSSGAIGIVGTAVDGEPNHVHALSSMSEAVQIFGSREDAGYQGPSETLLRSLELIFSNGGSSVYAVRAAGDRPEDYATALAELENELVNIVLLAGQDSSNTEMVARLIGHLSRTEDIKRERVGIIGCGVAADVNSILANVPVLDNSTLGNTYILDHGRLIYVAPGVSVKSRSSAGGEAAEETLSGAYTAAAVAGLIASLPVQSSPTNKALNITGLARRFDFGEVEKLVAKNVLAVEQREGYRIVKGVTTSGNTAWAQITTRRIVDYAIYGVRAACNPYIGKLNNARVRNAMKATLDSFLTRMVDSQALTGYSLDVSATRSQEIAGQAIVSMTINPILSGDYIMITMTLG